MSRRLLWEDDVIKAVDKHTNDNNTLDNDISCILEEVDAGWIKCVPGQMPEDDEKYKGRKTIGVLVTTANGQVTKAQRQRSYNNKDKWIWGRVYGECKAWMPLPKEYKEN